MKSFYEASTIITMKSYYQFLYKLRMCGTEWGDWASAITNTAIVNTA